MKQQRIASWIFGGISFLFLIGVFCFAPRELPEQNHRILGLMAAFAAGFLGYFLSGSLGIDGKADLKPYGKFAIKAGGGFALFVLVLYWWNSAESPSKTVGAVKSLDHKVDALSSEVEQSVNRILQAFEAKDKANTNLSLFPEIIASARLLLERGDKKQRAIAEIALRHTNSAQALLSELETPAIDEAFEILTLKGDNWYFSNREDEAIVPYEQALALKPDDPKALMNVGAAHANAHLGDKTQHVEIALARLQQAEAVAKKNDRLVQWAQAKHLLGDTWGERRTGDAGENLTKAIAAYEDALTVRTRTAFPELWALTKTNLAGCLIELPTGDHRENIHRAIAACEDAQSVLTKTDYPTEYAALQSSLGDAWAEIPEGDRDQNRRKAISLYEDALSFRTREHLPLDWALTRNSLAGVLTELESGNRVENLRKAIAIFESILPVYTAEALPDDWARTHLNLSLIYEDLAEIPGQDKSALFAKAMDEVSQALTVWTETAYPNDHRNAAAVLARYRSHAGPTHAAFAELSH